MFWGFQNRSKFVKGPIPTYYTTEIKIWGHKPGNFLFSGSNSLTVRNDLIFQAFIQLIIVCAQLLLMHNAKWDRLVSLCLEQFCGYWNLFRIVRNGLTGIENKSIWYFSLNFYLNFVKLKMTFSSTSVQGDARTPVRAWNRPRSIFSRAKRLNFLIATCLDGCLIFFILAINFSANKRETLKFKKNANTETGPTGKTSFTICRLRYNEYSEWSRRTFFATWSTQFNTSATFERRAGFIHHQTGNRFSWIANQRYY